MNFLKVFFAFLFLGALLLLKTDAAEASKWGPNCSSAPADHRICPSGNTPAYATTCIDSVNIEGGVVGHGLTPVHGNITVTVKAAAAQLVCSSVLCLLREDTQDVTVTPNNGDSNPAAYLIDTLGCSGGNCDDNLTISIASINKRNYTSCTSSAAITGRLDQNGQTIGPFKLHVSCTPPAPTNTPTPTLRPQDSPCAPFGDVNDDGKISNVDVTWINEYSARTRTLTSTQIERADVNGDGNVNSVDSTIILAFLVGSVRTFTVCEQPSPTDVPNACNVTCTRDAYCTGSQYSSQNQCTVCLPDGSGNNTCQVPPACNSSCVRDSDCNAGPALRDGCIACVNNTCQVPSPTPTIIPPPTATPTQVPSPTPTSIPPPTTTPTPAFNEDMCKCDGIEYTDLFSGQPTTITSYGKVIGADVSRAKLVSQTFSLYEGDGDLRTRLIKSGPIPASIESQSASIVRYKSIWQFTMPQLKNGVLYSIQRVFNCQPKLQALNYTPSGSSQKGVLATSTSQPKSFIDRVIDFLNNLFGRGPTATTSVTSEPGTETGIVLEDPTPTDKKSLQLETIYPVEVYQKTCEFIKFRYGQATR